jgi:hypothetical protein
MYAKVIGGIIAVILLRKLSERKEPLESVQKTSRIDTD